jgi:enoyl reductase-like protein
MNAIKFVKDDQSVWSKDLEDGRTITSVCVEVTDEVLNMNTLFTQVEKSMVWLKGSDEAVVLKQQDAVIKAINKGQIKPYRAFSETPFYEGQEEDINPTTEEPLGRYSQVRLCPADKHADLHRQYVVPTVASAKPAVEEKEETQPKIGA